MAVDHKPPQGLEVVGTAVDKKINKIFMRNDHHGNTGMAAVTLAKNTGTPCRGGGI